MNAACVVVRDGARHANVQLVNRAILGQWSQFFFNAFNANNTPATINSNTSIIINIFTPFAFFAFEDLTNETNVWDRPDILLVHDLHRQIMISQMRWTNSVLNMLPLR